MTVEEILKTEDITPLFRKSDLVGTRTARGMVNNAILKKVAGYWTGQTMYNIIVDLELWNDETQELTELGRKYFTAIPNKKILNNC